MSCCSSAVSPRRMTLARPRTGTDSSARLPLKRSSACRARSRIAVETARQRAETVAQWRPAAMTLVPTTGVCSDRRSLSWRQRCPDLLRCARREPAAAPRRGRGADRPRRGNRQGMAPACPRASRAGPFRRPPSSRHRLVTVASPVRERQALLAGLNVSHAKRNLGQAIRSCGDPGVLPRGVGGVGHDEAAPSPQGPGPRGRVARACWGDPPVTAEGAPSPSGSSIALKRPPPIGDAEPRAEAEKR